MYQLCPSKNMLTQSKDNKSDIVALCSAKLKAEAFSSLYKYFCTWVYTLYSTRTYLQLCCDPFLRRILCYKKKEGVGGGEEGGTGLESGPACAEERLR